MKWFNRAARVVVLAGLAGCTPWPHHYITAPQISGTIIRDGKPAVGVHVQLVDVLNSSGEIATGATHQDTTTDADGHFSIGPISHVSRTGPVPLFNVPERGIPWGMRLSTDGQAWQPGWVTDPQLLGVITTLPLVANCDLSAASKSSDIKNDEAEVGNGSCELAAPEPKK